MRFIKHNEFAQGSVCKVYAKFSDEQAGLKSMKSSYLGRQNSWTPIEKCEAKISLKIVSALPSTKRTQCSLTLVWASTVDKVQGLSFEQGMIDFDLRKQKSFGPGQMYTASSIVKTYDNLYCTGEFKKYAIKVNKDALLEYERLKQNDLFSTIKTNAISNDTVGVLIHNVRSLARHVDDSRIINNGIIAFTETQISHQIELAKY